MGRLIAGLPVAGSVVFALLTREPPCDVRAPFILMSPSGPRTTPGIRGNNESARSCWFGAFKIVDLSMTDWSDESVETACEALAVTVTDSFTVSTRSSIWASTTVPDSTLTIVEPLRPGAVTSIS